MSRPDPTAEQLSVARQMRARARRGWYTGDEASLLRWGVWRDVRGATDRDLAVRLLLSRDRMHHSVGWWRNAEYEFCWHLSVSAVAWERRREYGTGRAPFEQVPRAEADLWAWAIYGDHVRKLWVEPGGTDPRLTREEARRHATMWHLRLFLDPELLDARGEPHVPFVPRGEVYDLTRWVPGLTPDKVDR